MKKILDSLKYIKMNDFKGFIFFLVILPFVICIKIYNKIIRKKVWLISEVKDAARDNGYHLFKFIRTNYPKENVYYVIEKDSSDYKKIEEYGNIIEFGSLKHWIYYLTADKLISNHKASNPCPPLFYILHVYLNLFNNRIFLQHGITKDDSPWIYYKNTKFRLFVCGAKKEYEYVKEKFGYPEDNVKYLGFARFDNLHNNNVNNNQILIMPTWRNWLGKEKNSIAEDNIPFEETEYYKRWNGLLNNKELIEYVEKNNLVLYFYPHVHMQKFLNKFDVKTDSIKIVDNSKIDIQTLLKESSFLITDYSSVFMDFAYMKKPMCYYQFDIEKYRKGHLQQGYYEYKRDGFGPVIEDENELVNYIIKECDTNYKTEEKYLDRMNNFFELHDDKNCQRIYNCIKNIK